jgi:hypothetical protein
MLFCKAEDLFGIDDEIFAFEQLCAPQMHSPDLHCGLLA